MAEKWTECVWIMVPGGRKLEDGWKGLWNEASVGQEITYLVYKYIRSVNI